MIAPKNPCCAWAERLLSATMDERESFRAEMERLRERLAESERLRGELRAALVSCQFWLRNMAERMGIGFECLEPAQAALDADAKAGGQT